MKAVADLPAPAEPSEQPNESLLVVMGEKGRSQLQRDQREHIFATIAGALHPQMPALSVAGLLGV